MKTNQANKLSDNELIAEIVKSNNTHLFAVLYDRYANVVYNKCMSFAKSQAEAQDLTHDIFIQLFVKLKSFKGQSKFSTWLYSFTYNFCVNYVQRNAHKKMEKKAVNVDDTNTKELPFNDVDDASIFELKSEKLAKAMSLIDPDDKMILLLKYQDDVPIKELQDVLEIGQSAVKMRLKRAKSRLMEAYKGL